MSGIVIVGIRRLLGSVADSHPDHSARIQRSRFVTRYAPFEAVDHRYHPHKVTRVEAHNFTLDSILTLSQSRKISDVIESPGNPARSDRAGIGLDEPMIDFALLQGTVDKQGCERHAHQHGPAKRKVTICLYGRSQSL